MEVACDAFFVPANGLMILCPLKDIEKNPDVENIGPGAAQFMQNFGQAGYLERLCSIARRTAE